MLLWIAAAVIVAMLFGGLLTYAFLFWRSPNLNVLRNLQDGVLVLNQQYKIVWMNERLAELLEIDPKQFKGKPYPELARRFQVDEQALANLDNPRYEIVHNDHIIEPVTSTLRNPLGQEIGRVMIFRDMTRRAIAEKALNSRMTRLDILRRIYSELGTTLNIQTVLLYAMDSLTRLSGAGAGYIALVPEDNPTAPPVIAHVIGEYDDKALSQMLSHSLGISGRVMKSHESERVLDVTKDPDYLRFHDDTQAVICVPLLNLRGVLIGLLYLETSIPERFHDETYQFIQLLASRIAAAIENARLYRQLRLQYEELQASHDRIAALENLKTDMIRIAAHDLRNPINALMLHLSILERVIDQEMLNERGQRSLNQMNIASERLKNMVESILSLERIEGLAQSNNIMLETVNLYALLQQVIEEHAASATEKHIDISLEADASLSVHGDWVQLQEAFSNLLINAIKYTPPNGAVTVRVMLDTQGVCVAVQDTGFGIPEDMQSRLFEPFYRVKTTETQHIVGTGLGLHLVQNIVQRHGGEVKVNSVYREGSTFTICLPPMVD